MPSPAKVIPKLPYMIRVKPRGENRERDYTFSYDTMDAAIDRAKEMLEGYAMAVRVYHRETKEIFYQNGLFDFKMGEK